MQSIYSSWMRSTWFVMLLAGVLTGCETSPPRVYASPTFDPTDQLEYGRARHVGVSLLEDGRRRAKGAVLVLGGMEGPGGSATIGALYDADAKWWRGIYHPSGNNNFGVSELARVDLTANVMVDGYVLVMGGNACAVVDDSTVSLCSPNLGICEPCKDGRILRTSVLRYNPQASTNGWDNSIWLTKRPHSNHTVTVISEKNKNHPEKDIDHVVVIGGLGKSLEETMEQFDYTRANGLLDAGLVMFGEAQPSSLSPMEDNAKLSMDEWSGHTATRLPKKTPNDPNESDAILVVGRIKDKALCQAYLAFGGQNKPWEGPLPVPPDVRLPCEGHAASLIGLGASEMVAIVGGQSANGAFLQQTVLFDPRTRMFSPTVFAMKFPHSHGATIATNSGRLIAAGGLLGTNKAGQELGRTEVEQFDLESKTWKRLPDMKCARVRHTMTMIGPKTADSPAEHYLVVGGSSADSSETCKSIGDAANSSEILYLNDVCKDDVDCSPGNTCTSKRCAAN